MCVFSSVLIAFTALSKKQIIKMSCAFTCCCCCHLTSFLPKLMKSSFYDSARLLLLMKERAKVENAVFMRRALRSPYEALRYITKFAKPIKGGYTHEFPLENRTKKPDNISQIRRSIRINAVFFPYNSSCHNFLELIPLLHVTQRRNSWLNLNFPLFLFVIVLGAQLCWTVLSFPSFSFFHRVRH